MKNISVAILAACILTFGGVAVQAQWTNCSGNSADNDCLCYNVLSPSSGGSNAVFGNHSMVDNSGYYNSALGVYALYNNTAGDYNTGVGYEALYNNYEGYYNTAVGTAALYSGDSTSNNTAVGYGALYEDTGNQNTAVGFDSGATITNGANNTTIGYYAGDSTTTGGNNIDIGYEAGFSNTTGSYNIEIGSEGSSSDSGVIRIGTSGQQTAFYAPAIDEPITGTEVEIDTATGQLGVPTSSIRFKKDVRNMGDASSEIYRLRPVTFRYKKTFADGSHPVEYGLIAEEVAEVYPDMVGRNANGTIETVEYQKLTPHAAQ